MWFTQYAKLRHVSPLGDSKKYPETGLIDLSHIVYNFLGSSSEIFRVRKGLITDEDNGTFVVNKDWDIVETRGGWYQQDEYDLTEFMVGLDYLQPPRQQLGEEYITGPTKKIADLVVGDTFYTFGGEQSNLRLAVVQVESVEAGQIVFTDIDFRGNISQPGHADFGNTLKLKNDHWTSIYTFDNESVHLATGPVGLVVKEQEQ